MGKNTNSEFRVNREVSIRYFTLKQTVAQTY